MKLEKTILLVRHGTTEYNEHERLQGQIDIDLNQKGCEEAQAISNSIQGQPLDIICHSPLKRAFHTAAVINSRRDIPMEIIDEFVEIDLGDWEGMLFDEVVTNHADLYEEWLSSVDTAIPGGESFNQVFNRVQRGVEKILAYPHSHVLVVGHATVNRAILGHMLHLTPRSARLFRQKNAALSKFIVYRLEKNGERRIVVDYWNDTAHLRLLP